MTLFDPTLGGGYPTHPGLSGHSTLECGQLLFRPTAPDTVISIPVSGGGRRQTTEAYWGMGSSACGSAAVPGRERASGQEIAVTWFSRHDPQGRIYVVAVGAVRVLFSATAYSPPHRRIIHNVYRCEWKTCYGCLFLCMRICVCLCLCMFVCVSVVNASFD